MRTFGLVSVLAGVVLIVWIVRPGASSGTAQVQTAQNTSSNLTNGLSQAQGGAAGIINNIGGIIGLSSKQSAPTTTQV